MQVVYPLETIIDEMNMSNSVSRDDSYVQLLVGKIRLLFINPVFIQIKGQYLQVYW